MTDTPAHQSTQGQPMAEWVKAACVLVVIQHAASAVIQVNLLLQGSSTWHGGLLALNLLVMVIMSRAIDGQRRLVWRFGVLPTWSASA